MTRKPKHVVLIAAAAGLAAASVAAGLALASRSAHAVPIAAVGDRLSPLEAAEIRDELRGKLSEPAADADITGHGSKSVDGKEWKIVSYRAKSGKLCAGASWPAKARP